MSTENGNSHESLFELVITHDPITKAFEIRGAQRDRVVVIGMLEYALMLVRRKDAQDAALEAMRNAPRISVAGGPLS